MDDFILLATTRWKLKRAVKAVNQRLNALKLEKHPDKTFIGRIDKGVDFLGYHFSPNELHTCCLRYRQPLGADVIAHCSRAMRQEADIGTHFCSPLPDQMTSSSLS